jgi:transposase
MSAATDPAASREDLLALIALLREQNVALAERCALLEERAVLVEEQNAQLIAANERLTKRVAELERRLNRNSGNSNFPPSQDVFGLLKKDKPEAKPKPEAKRGKRKGAAGAGLGMVENPDKIRDHRPRACGDCGARLRGAPSVGFARRQVTDIPVVTVKVTEHRLHKVRCGCGHTTSAQAPEGLAGAPASYGSNLRAPAVYLVVFHHVPVERAALLIADLTGAAVSTG